MAEEMDEAAMAEEMQYRPHVAVMVSPGMGHLIPSAEFAKQLAGRHGVSVALVTLSAGPPCKAQQAYVDALPSHIRCVQLPPVYVDDLPPDAKIQTIICTTFIRSLPALRDALRSMVHLVALVVDLFGAEAFDVAQELGLRPYIFYTCNCTFLSLHCHLPAIDEATQEEFRDFSEPIRFPGCIPFMGSDLPDQDQDRKDEGYQCVLRLCRRYREAEGIFVNSFSDLEPGPLAGLKSMEPEFPPVYPVGPLIQSVMAEAGGSSECLRWLDEQPAGSVLFVSFGSGGALSPEQMTELALGLELSEQKFLWAVRSPSETKTSDSEFFTAESRRDPLAYLPDGFLHRTAGVGRVVPSWAPQMEILGHESTGGFLSHCGWNSALESVVKGVPLIAWPLYAEQKMNAKVLVEEMKVAMRPTTETGRGVVARVEVARVVKAVMEGKEGKGLRRRMKELGECGARAVAPGGTSYMALSHVTKSWKERPHPHL